jgi:long-subunit fatty acid transport protein
MKITIAGFLLFVILCYPLLASEDKYGAEFLNQMVSAEGGGMGESLTSYSIGSRSMNNNPAGLSFSKGNELFIGSYRTPPVVAVIMKENGEIWEDYGKYDVKSTEMEYINYLLPRSKLGSLGLSFAFNHSGRFIRVNEEGTAVNAFPQDDMLIGIGYSLNLNKGIAVGFDLKSLRSKIPTDNGNKIGRTYVMNVGLMHQVSDRVRIGASLQNIGNKLSFKGSDISTKLRKNFILGAIYKVKDSKKSKLSVSMDVNTPFEDGLRYKTGIEFLYAQCLAIRAGYMRDTQPYYDALVNLNDGSFVYEKRVWVREGITLGVGIKLKNAEINLARMPYREPILNDGEKLRLEKQESVTSLSFIARF